MSEREVEVRNMDNDCIKDSIKKLVVLEDIYVVSKPRSIDKCSPPDVYGRYG